MQTISASELVLMKIIWEQGGNALYSHIMDELGKQENLWNKNTVLTLLSRLVEKQFLSTSKIGRRNEYSSLISEPEYQANQTRGFLAQVYDGNVGGLVATLIEQDILSDSDFNELQKFWEEKKR